MNSKIKSIINNEFVKNVFSLFTGNALAQSISLVSIPVLTRLYTPEEFGAVALFIGMVNVFSIASNGRYDMAIVLPKKDGQAFHLLIGSIAITFLFSIISLLVVILFFDRLTGMFEAHIYKKIIWLLPLCIFLLGSHKSLTYWFNRSRSFRLIGINRVIQNAGQTGVRLCREMFSNGHWGQVVGFITGEIISWGTMVIQLFRREFWRFKYISIKTTFKSFREYFNFPLYLMPMGILNTFSTYLLVFALSLITSSALVGHYERAWRVINFPLSLISSSFGSVFYEKMNRTSNRHRLYVYSYLGNLCLALLILFPIAFWGESIFCFVLGNDWAVAGRIARFILPLTVFGFATECVSTVFSVTKKNQIMLLWQVVYLIFVLGWLVIARKFDVYLLLLIYSSIGSVMYIALAVMGLLSLQKTDN